MARPGCSSSSSPSSRGPGSLGPGSCDPTVVIILGASICLAVAATLPDISEWLGDPLKRIRGPGRRPKLYLERWLYTSEGSRSPARMSVLETTLPGTGYRKMPGERLPWVRFVILIACSRVGLDLDSRQVWSQFEAFLQQPAASGAASMMTGARADLRWARRGTPPGRADRCRANAGRG